MAGFVHWILDRCWGRFNIRASVAAAIVAGIFAIIVAITNLLGAKGNSTVSQVVSTRAPNSAVVQNAPTIRDQSVGGHNITVQGDNNQLLMQTSEPLKTHGSQEAEGPKAVSGL